MKKIYLFVFLILALSLCFVNKASALDNLLLNPGFEDNLNDWNDLWGLPADLDNTVFHSGSFSAVKNVDSVTDRAYWSQLYQEIEFTPGQPVYASVYIKTTFSPLASARAGLMLQFMDDDNNVLGATIKGKDVGGNTNWALVELTAGAAPAGTTKAMLSCFVWAAQGDDLSLEGNAYFDDAFLIKASKPIPAQPKLLNPGFENGMSDWSELWGYPAYVVASGAYSGTYAAVKKVEDVSTRDYWSMIYQEVSCPPSKKLIATLYAKANFARKSKGNAGLMLEFFDAKDKLLKKYTKYIKGTVDWRKIAITVSKTPAKTAKVRFSAYIYAPRGNVASLGALAYFDNTDLLIQ